MRYTNPRLLYFTYFGELKTEQLGGHSQEQQRHRQAPIDDMQWAGWARQWQGWLISGWGRP